MLRHPAALVLALGVTVCAQAGSAAERTCLTTTVTSDARFRARFPELLARIQDDLGARSDFDACARITLRVEDDATIRIAVTLPDGRTAAREVFQSHDVLPTLQALLLVPERPVRENTPVAVATKSPPARISNPAEPEPQRSDRAGASSRPTTGRDARVELSLVAGARIGDGQFGAGGGVQSLLDASGWLFGFLGRADRYQPVAGGDPDVAIELGLLMGRRFDLGGVALDLDLGPAVAMKGFVLSRTTVARANTMAAPPPPEPDPSSGTVPRLLLDARLGLSPHSRTRSFVGLEGELGPRRINGEVPPGSARMPSFAVGLALGATLGGR
jgi:hypothetical protein